MFLNKKKYINDKRTYKILLIVEQEIIETLNASTIKSNFISKIFEIKKKPNLQLILYISTDLLFSSYLN